MGIMSSAMTFVTISVAGPKEQETLILKVLWDLIFRIPQI